MECSGHLAPDLLIDITIKRRGKGYAMVGYKEVFDKFSVATFIIDREHQIINMNKSALSMFKNYQ